MPFGARDMLRFWTQIVAPSIFLRRFDGSALWGHAQLRASRPRRGLGAGISVQICFKLDFLFLGEQ